MRVDLGALASFAHMGEDGSENATAALEALTDSPAHTLLTRTAVVDTATVSEFLGSASARYAVPFDGALSGTAFVSFEESFAAHAADAQSIGGDPLPEMANILTSGFVDVWAADAPETVDVQPPEPVGDEDPVPEAGSVDGYAFVFESQVGTEAAEGACRFTVVPDVDPFLDYLVGEDDVVVPMAEFVAYIRLTQESAAAVASHVGAMTGHDADVVESHLDLVPVERVPSLLDDAAYSGAVFECEGPVDSVVAVLFDEAERGAVAEAMLADDDPDESLARSAVAELGNVTASGFLDGWANRLDATIDVSTPSHVRDEGGAILDGVAAAFGRHADTVAVLDTVVDVSDDVTCRVCVIPDPADSADLDELTPKLLAGEEP